MARLVTIHSFRGGTGKSNLLANIAWLAARDGAKVGVLDTDLQSPGIHVILGDQRHRTFNTLSDFVLGQCELDDVPVDVTEAAGVPTDGGGQLLLFPSSMHLDDITRVLSDGYQVERLNAELSRLHARLGLDLVLLDTHPGLNQETMLSASICDRLVLVIRPDDQDFQGTAVLCEVAERIGVPQVSLLANRVVEGVDEEQLRSKLEEAFRLPVDAVLPEDPDMARLGSREVFAARYPDHAMTRRLEALTHGLIASLPREERVPS